MNRWSIYQSDEHHENRVRGIKNTLGLVFWLLFRRPKHIVTINKRKS